MDQEQAFTDSEMVFMKRMLHHFMNGMDAMRSANAVMDDDARILAAAFDMGKSEYIPTACEIGRSSTPRIGKGDVIFREISKTVYEKLTTQRNR